MFLEESMDDVIETLYHYRTVVVSPFSEYFSAYVILTKHDSWWKDITVLTKNPVGKSYTIEVTVDIEKFRMICDMERI